jgi:hypothetical protein
MSVGEFQTLFNNVKASGRSASVTNVLEGVNTVATVKVK